MKKYLIYVENENGDFTLTRRASTYAEAKSICENNFEGYNHKISIEKGTTLKTLKWYKV